MHDLYLPSKAFKMAVDCGFITADGKPTKDYPFIRAPRLVIENKALDPGVEWFVPDGVMFIGGSA